MGNGYYAPLGAELSPADLAALANTNLTSFKLKQTACGVLGFWGYFRGILELF